ncbi:MAG: GDP-L-fucose synthase [Candidatus Eremiobacteraeota bacterium]|nr:GDP-L-fucose synthase [Candidatus Eremiobacteraeota bacterium]
MERSDRVLILGARGLVGSAFHRLLLQENFTNVVACGRRELDITDARAVLDYFRQVKPDYVLMAAGKVGGIHANSAFPWNFAYDNIVMASNVLEAVRQNGAKKVLMLGSTCIYPRLAPQPIQEESLLSGPLEPTNQWYAIAKIAGIKLGQALRRQHGISVIAAMPTNLYGPNDNFQPEYSHVLPALLHRFHAAKEQAVPKVEIWGTGSPRREFLYVDDLAAALLLLFQVYDDEQIINVGTGQDLEIRELVSLVAETVGYQGDVWYDKHRPDGSPRKQTDSTRLFELGWKPQVELREGLRHTYDWYLTALAQRALRGLVQDNFRAEI